MMETVYDEMAAQAKGRRCEKNTEEEHREHEVAATRAIFPVVVVEV
jgi:hypothetical protein